jgi:hypothetical protein
VARTQELADRVASTRENASLSADGTFRDDLSKLGEPGIATGWIDARAAAEALDSFAGDTKALGDAGLAGEGLADVRRLQRALGQVQDQLGHAAAAVRFDGPQLELAMAVSGGKAAVDAGPSGIGDLPADSLFALSASGLGDSVRAAWPKNDDSELAGLAKQFGLDLPDDLAALLGKRTQVAVGKPGADNPIPAFGVRVASSDPGLPGALEAVGRLAEGEDGFVQLHQQRTADGYVMSTDAQQLQVLAAGGGGLGAQPGFASVLPDAGTAQLAAYLDLAGCADLLQGLGGNDADSAEDMKLLKELGAVGLSATTEADGSARVSLRIGVT